MGATSRCIRSQEQLDLHRQMWPSVEEVLRLDDNRQDIYDRWGGNAQILHAFKPPPCRLREPPRRLREPPPRIGGGALQSVSALSD